MSAETWFRALRVFEFEDARPLQRFLTHTEQPRRDLRDHIVVIRFEFARKAAFARRSEGAEFFRRDRAREHRHQPDRPERHPTAVPRKWQDDLLAITATVERERQVYL